MKHLIVYAHPNPESFNHAILQVVTDKIKSLGGIVEVRDLYKINFNPSYSIADYRSMDSDSLPPDVKCEQEYISKADKITFIAPIWWNGLPAILKGYFDRVFTMDFAVSLISEGMVGLLGEKKFGMINTFASSKETMIKNGNIHSLGILIDQGVFAICGSPLCFHQYFYEVNTCGEARRKSMLDEVKKIMEQFILNPNYCPFFG